MLQSIHEAFARAVSNALSSFLESEVGAKLAGIRPTTAGEFQKSLPNPSCLILLRLHPGPEAIMLYLETSTALALLDLLLGGAGTPVSPVRELTEIEWSLLEEISRTVLRSLGESWQTIKPVEFVVEAMGCDPGLIACAEPTRSDLRLSFEMQTAGHFGQFEFSVPSSFFAPITTRQRSPDIPRDLAPEADRERNARLLEDAEVKLEVHLEGPKLSFRDFLTLQQGHVVKLDHALNAPVRALVNGDASLVGHILSAGHKRAFQVEELFTVQRT